MGFFADIASEARRSMAAPARQTVAPPAAPEPAPPVAAPDALTAQPVPMPPAPAEASSPPQADPAPSAHTPPPPEVKLAVEQNTDDTAARETHEAAESKRKAEFDARQAEKRQAALDRIAAMNGAELLSAAVGRVAADMERLTRRNMKTAVAESISNKCRGDTAFARLVMDPEKSMIHCFQYINRMAKKIIEDAIKAENPNPESGIYGDDVPDDLVYLWAARYFEDPNTKEDKDDEKFIPKPYVPPARKPSKAKAAKGKSEKETPAAEKPEDAGGSMEQISLM